MCLTDRSCCLLLSIGVVDGLITFRSPCMVMQSRDDRSRSKSRSRSRSKSRHVPTHTPHCVFCAVHCKLSSAEVELLAGVVTDQSHRHSATPEGMNTCLTLQESVYRLLNPSNSARLLRCLHVGAIDASLQAVLKPGNCTCSAVN